MFDFFSYGFVVVLFDCVGIFVKCVGIIVKKWYLFNFGDGGVFDVWSGLLFRDYLCWYLKYFLWLVECCVGVGNDLLVVDEIDYFVVGVLCDGVVVVYLGYCIVSGYFVGVCVIFGWFFLYCFNYWWVWWYVGWDDFVCWICLFCY